MRAYLRTLRTVNWIQLFILSFIVAFCCVFGISYVDGAGWQSMPLSVELGLTAAGTILCACIGLAFDALFGRLRNPVYGPYLPRRQIPLPLLGAVMLLAWLPWLIANFPGSSFYDTVFQIYQFYPHELLPQIQYQPVAADTLVYAWIVDHHPWVTTLIYGSVAWMSDQLTGTWMAGFFVFSTVQSLLYIVLFMRIIHLFRKWGVPRGVRIGFFVLVCLVPAFPVWASCVMKDSLFGLFFLAWFIMLVECVLSQGEDLRQPKRIIVMFLLALMMCLTKKTGVYIVLAAALVACILYRKQRHIASPLSAFALQGIGCALLMFLVVPLIVFPALNIVPGGKQEALGTLFQQTSRYVQANEITPEEERIIDRVIAIEAVRENYDPVSQDSVKYYYNTRSYDESLMNYLRLYVEQGFKDPEAYFASLMSIGGLYVAPTRYLNLRMTTVESEFQGKIMLWNPPELDGMREGMDEAYQAYASIPVLNVPVLAVVYAFWLPMLLLFVCLKRRLRLGLLFVPLAVVFAFCIIGPVYDARYAWGLLLGVPFLFGVVTIAPSKE